MANGKILLTSIVFSVFALYAVGQAPMKSIEKGGKRPEKLDKSKVPAVVKQIYIKEYPAVTYDTWYGYPAFADGSDWYGYDSDLITDNNPEYFIVDFTSDQTPNKVIYAKSGKKIATHRILKSELPLVVANALKNGKYGTWKIKKEKEEIFRDTDKMKVYKIVVTKGMERHSLFYQADGKLLKDRITMS